MAEMTLIEALRQAMEEELARDDRVFLVGEDVGRRGGVFRATQGLYEKFGAGRIINSPLAELSIIGIGIGAALYGLRPICEIQFADFIHPAFNQIVNEAAKMCYRSNGEWTVPLVIRAPYGGGIGGGLYHSQSLEAFFAHVPGLKVVIPSNPHDAKGLLKAAVRDPNPVIFLEPKKGYRLIKGEVAGPGEILEPLGVARVTRSGTDLTAIAYGMMHHYTLQAAQAVAGEGLSVEVVDVRTLLPLDKATLLASVRKTGQGVGRSMKTISPAATAARSPPSWPSEAFTDLDAPIRRLAGPDVPAMPYSHPLQDWFMLNPEKIAAAMRELAAY